MLSGRSILAVCNLTSRISRRASKDYALSMEVASMVWHLLRQSQLAPTSRTRAESSICPMITRCGQLLVRIVQYLSAALSSQHTHCSGWYLGELCANLTRTLTPEVIVIGSQLSPDCDALFDAIRKRCMSCLAGYGSLPRSPEEYIVPSEVDESCRRDFGCLELGFQALAQAERVE